MTTLVRLCGYGVRIEDIAAADVRTADGADLANSIPEILSAVNHSLQLLISRRLFSPENSSPPITVRQFSLKLETLVSDFKTKSI